MAKKYFFMFPGQGSQSVGMGKDLYDNVEPAKELFAKAADITGQDMAKLCFEGPEEELKKTENTQPAIFLCSYILDHILKQKGIQPIVTAGHSLGEYSAVASAGYLPFEEALKLVSERGRIMAKVGQSKPGTMAAIIGLSNADVEAVCEEASSQGIAVPANYNSEGQVVISGEKEAILKAIELAKEKGAKRALELQVSGAFHSPLMNEAVEEFKGVLDGAQFIDGSLPVISNVTAKPVADKSEIKALLLRQLNSPVRWLESINGLAGSEVEEAIEVGPGKVLTGLLKRINREMKCTSVDSAAAINTLPTE